MNVFDLAARITLDTSDYEQGLDDASRKSSSLASKIGSGLKTAAKVGAVALSAAAAGVAALTKTSIQNYAEYEQLVGGAELLFGDAYSYIADKAAGAYSTVQMSQNDYLRQVNGFATGLKTALGGNEQLAAELADKIVTAEADIVAATGNTQENVQNAFNGIMKSNYTMLDNLQLGITPTKEGFQEVIDKVNEWNEANGRTTNYVIDNLADCQSALIDYIDMQGLSGYASEEASKTIQGSISSMKAAWTNLVTSLGDENANVSANMETFVDTVVTAAGNIVPRIGIILQNIGPLIAGLAPIIAEQLPGLIETLVPSVIQAAASLIGALVQNLPEILSSLFTAISSVVDSLIGGLGDQFPFLTGILNTLKDVIPIVVGAFVAYEAITKAVTIAQGLLNAVLNANPFVLIISLVGALVLGLKTLWDTNEGFRNAVKNIWSAITGFFTNAVNSIKNAWSSVTSFFSNIWNNIKNVFSNAGSYFLSIGKNIVQGIWNGISGMVSWFTSKVKNFFSGIVNSVKGLLGIHSPSKVFAGIGGFMAEGLGEGWDDAYSKIEHDINKDLDFSGNITTSGSYSGYGKSYGTALSGAIFNINVNGANIQDDQSLAERIAFEIQQMVDRKEAVFGAA